MTAGDMLEPFRRAPDRAGMFLDFDGVLSDIVTTYHGARPRPGVPDLLTELVGRLGRVAVISGRPVSYLADHLPEVVDVVGLYGLEWRTGGRHETMDGAESWRGVIASTAAEAVAEFGPEAVEPKGLSLTLHYRRHGAEESSISNWARDRARVTGLEKRAARMSVELHPPIDRDKGRALLDLAAGLDPVAFMGDDIGDLPAFDALDELADRGVETLRIAVGSAEAPTALIERADMVVDGPAGAEQLLRGMIAEIDAARD